MHHPADSRGARRLRRWKAVLSPVGVPERDDPPPFRRRGKEARERVAAMVLLGPAAAVMVAAAAAMGVEAVIDPASRGPVFFVEARMSRGRTIRLLKFRILNRATIDALGDGPTHIKGLEATEVTRVGRVLRDWYLDELPQIINVARGDMFFIGTRPWPVEQAAAEVANGQLRKFEMPAGLIGPVQSYKGVTSPSELELDNEYWEAFTTWSWWDLLMLDVQIVRRSITVQMAHEGR